jgi:hypothetical protein
MPLAPPVTTAVRPANESMTSLHPAFEIGGLAKKGRDSSFLGPE